MQNSFHEQLSSGKFLLGTIISLGSPEIVELLAACGFDWLFIDMEHGALDYTTAQRMIMAAGNNSACVLRVPNNDEVWIKKALDLGPAGIIIPQMRTKADAENAVRYSKFPPEGERSVGIARAHGYGMGFNDYIQRANDEVSLILQVEHIQAVENIDSILQVEGFDALLVGPYDLSGSMGIIGQIDDPKVVNAISEVRARCQEANVPLGIFAANIETARLYIEEGFKLMAVGMDMMLLGGAAMGVVNSLQDIRAVGTPKNVGQ